ncbi:PREDICTED: uncharacterized protein LOC104801928 [Tarenaya hassleriana]|uniref:uncharacterized protein LOC104801928 n=1 Tax=Tarenaya hassleriana TaxID=28532 RepID=UPI00053C8CC7|nr:PREDICTED: uncharacterized protein LOC104801928 [Tarenaya hassleriana]
MSCWGETRSGAVCRTEECPWRIYASLESSMSKWMVKVFHPHHSHIAKDRADMVSMRHIAELFCDVLRRNPSYKAADIQHDMKTEYQLTVPISKCFKARRIALDMVMQDQVVQFAKLWDYEHELRRSNPNTTTEIVIDNGLFNKFYICFEVLRNSWKKSCRPVIGLDGCFLKWELKGELLAAVGRDADNRIFPIAWAVVHMETIDSWTWFVQKLKADLSLGDGQNITILSDKQKDLLNAIHHELPRAEHRMCARHIYDNWKKSFKSLELKCLFWRIATSFHQGMYAEHMGTLASKDPDAYEALLRTEPTQWCRAFFKVDSHCKDVHNNLSESFNRTIKEARLRPMIDMLEEIRRQTMLRIAKRSVQATKCVTEFTPKIMAELEEARGKSRHCMMIPSGRGKYEVMEFGVSFSVDLYAKSCACRRWDLTGVPCQHAITVINEMRYDLPRYVAEYYSKSTWEETYTRNIDPVNGEPMWEKLGKDPIGVPNFRRMPGRPTKFHRRKDPHESPKKAGHMTRHGRQMTCGRCRQVGHNAAGCKNEPVLVYGPKRKRGRPRKDVQAQNPRNQVQNERVQVQETQTNNTSQNSGTLDPTQPTQRSQTVQTQQQRPPTHRRILGNTRTPQFGPRTTLTNTSFQVPWK